MPEDRREAFYHDRVQLYGGQYHGFDLASIETMLSLLYTYDVMSQATGRYMADYGLSKASLNVLMLLGHGPAAGMQLHELGELLLVSRANITGLIDHLESKGYVTRSVDPEDRRARYARVTKKAEALLDKFMPVHYGKVKSMLQGLSEDEKGTLLHLLRKTRASIWVHNAGQAGKSDPVDNLSRAGIAGVKNGGR
ncbi:MAG TPA: MarR family transcriptional regulator [Bryobacteraceae bacterium]|nr:MarR family transcriptional regulator [Bryobacteraceae bacterium]